MKRNIFIGFLTSLMVISVGLLAYIYADRDDHIQIKEVKITVKDSSHNSFISEQDVRSVVKKLNMIGRDGNPDFAQEVETLVEAQTFVSRAECYQTSSGMFKIDVWQREPVARVIGDGFEFYIDKEGNELQLSNRYFARVIVINGSVSRGFIKKDLIPLINNIVEDKFLSALIEQIYVLPNKELIMIPNIGNHEILFGKIENVEEKFDNLYTIYCESFNIMGWNDYKKVNLKYKGQVVCTRKN